MDQQTYIPYREIAGRLNIKPGDVVLLTSDILKLAIRSRKKEDEFDVDAFIDSFKQALGDDGTLLIPAYNFDLENKDSYNIRKTEPMTGSLAVAALKRDDFVRTYNPLHSFLVWGKDAGRLAEMKNISSFGKDSPFAWLHEMNALMVFAGTSVAEAMTFTHYVEESLKVSYRKRRALKINYSDNDGVSSLNSFEIYAKKAGYTMSMKPLESIFETEGMTRHDINGIAFSSVRCKDAFNIISIDINENNAQAIASFSISLFFRDIIKGCLMRFNLFRTNYGKIRSAKRIS